MKPAPYGPFAYSPVGERPRLTWPGGAHLALWVIPNIEFFSLMEKVPAGSGGPGTPGEDAFPSALNLVGPDALPLPPPTALPIEDVLKGRETLLQALRELDLQFAEEGSAILQTDELERAMERHAEMMELARALGLEESLLATQLAEAQQTELDVIEQKQGFLATQVIDERI